MGEEEIHKALEIIKQPITVNCKEYHYFDQENYDKLVAVYDNCLWFIRNFEQINTTVERVQQENKQLRGVIEEVRKSIKDFQEYIDEAKDFYGDLDDNDVVKVSNLQILNNQMVRNYDLLQILDKAKGE